MDSPPKLSGETLIVHHIPLVHCQVSGGRQGGCGGSLKRGNPFSPPENLGLSRTTSLPERDVLQREALLYSSLVQTSSSGSWSSRIGGKEGRGVGRGGSTASDDSSFTSSNSEDQMMVTAHTLPRAKPRNRNPLRHNPFLLNTEDEDDEPEEEDDGDNLSGYLEDSSFHLHGDTNSALDDEVEPFHLHDLSFASEPFLLHSTLGKPWGLVGGGNRESLRGMTSDLSNQLDGLDLLELDGQRRHCSSGSNMSMDCGEQDWGDDDEEEDEDQLMRCGRNSKAGSSCSSTSAQRCSCCSISQNYTQHLPETFPEPFSECQQGYGSDSSCNSSDGVLVNFSVIYNKMNNAVPDRPPTGVAPGNLNSSTDHSCTSSVSEPPTGQREPTGGAFYLDLHTSPTEPPKPQQPPSCLGNGFPIIHEPHASTSSTCSCSVEHQGVLDLDANCNSYHLPPHSVSSGDLTSCLQSQARLVVATQNYYKLVTCDLSSQSSPSPAGSSVTSCSDEHSKGSPTPTQPSEYYLFRQRPEDEAVEEEEEAEEKDEESSRRDEDEEDEKEEEEKKKQQPVNGVETSPAVIEGQVYINVSPPMVGRGLIGGGATTSSSGNRPRSRSYDRNLDKSPPPRLGSLERMLSCPVRLSDSAAPPPTPPPRVTSFAEIARSKRRNGGAERVSPSLKTGADPFSSTYSAHSHSSVDFSPILEQRIQGEDQLNSSLSPVRRTRCYSQGNVGQHPVGARETRAKTEVLCSLRSLEFWFNHLYTHEDIIIAHYNSWGFLPLSQGPCQPLFEELLLLLQPLSLLPFDLDLLFEPHLLQRGQEHLRRKEQLCSVGQGGDHSARSTFQLMRGWSTVMAESAKEGGDWRAEGRHEKAGLRREGTWPRIEGVGSTQEQAGARLGSRKGGAGDDMKTGFATTQTMMEAGFANLWKEKGVSGQRLKGVGSESQGKCEDGRKDRRKESERDFVEEGCQRQDRQAGWWYQLMQSSQVYIDQSAEGSKFVKSEKRKRSAERRQGKLPPTREGVVEGAESSQEGEEQRSRKSSSSSSGDAGTGTRGRPSWMGSPPESVLNQEKEPSTLGAAGTRNQAAAQEESPSQGINMRWGRLFGSSMGSPLRTEGAEQRAKIQKSRLPSGWLGLDRSVIDLVAQTIGAGTGIKSEPSPPPTRIQTSPQLPSAQTPETNRSPCEVRALCHHIATEPGQLSFHKGDILRVLSKADPDWLLCCLGFNQGLVPIIYVSLDTMEDSQEPGVPGQH
ncbi:AP-4 complex accessory subunit RUSC2 [Lampris incognitus]|uniref:AP-4 complex accessory subunit RUSC2 n=1 Tax=Lampris incognitus TaxID=2546036 RepID=UPI0024B4F2EC|nr:AP-4 complex accessory subunit RUSC2 [Lampris incognitus]